MCIIKISFINTITSLLKKTIFLLFLTIISLNVSNAKDIHYAGFFLQSHENLKKEMPYSSKAFSRDLNEKNYRRISSFFESIVDQARNPNYTISKSLGKIKKGDALAFGVALTSEDVRIMEDNVQITLRFNIMCFDFIDKVLLYNSPTSFSFSISTKNTPDEQKIVEIISETIFSNDQQSNSDLLFQQLKERNQSGDELAKLFKIKNKQEGTSLQKNILSKIEKIPENFQRLRIGIDQIVIDDEAKKKFPQGFDYQTYKNAVAQRFESALSKNEISLIPYSLGSIGNRELGLISKFQDHGDFFLKLPEADMVFNLNVNNFISIEKALEDNYRLRKVVASKYTIKFIERSERLLLFNSSFYTSRIFRYGKNRKNLYEDDNLLLIYKILESYLFFEFSDLLKNPDENRIKEISKDANADMLKKLYMEITQ